MSEDFSILTEVTVSPLIDQTSNESSGIESPLPRALIYASLRAQQLKNLAGLSDCGRASSAAISLTEKNLDAISSDGTELSMNSTSTPTSRSIATAISTSSPE